MALYGNELGPDITPFEAGLGRVVKFTKPGDFVGRDALARAAEAGPRRVLTGLAGESRRVPRHGYSVLWDGQPCGTLAYLEPEAARQAAEEAADGGAGTGRLAVDVRGRAEPARAVPLPFYRRPA